MASFSLSLGAGPKNRKPSPPPLKNGTKRARAVLDDADSEDEDTNAGKRQNITHFDLSAGGAVDTSKPKVVKEALVIKAQANRDWKEASARNKRQKYGLPSEDQQRARENFVAPKSTTVFGLNVFKTDAGDGSNKEAATQDDAPAVSTEDVPAETASTKPRTDDERAIAALMGVEDESTRTIPAVTEEEALHRDTKEAPDAPTLEEYAAVPVEEFGAAMLRGMGWKEGQGIGNQRGQKTIKSKVPERRPALLGIGAKPDAAVAAELGAWGAGAKGRKRVDIVYNPLVLKNAKTGEHLTEEELKAKLQDQKEREANERYGRDSDRHHERRENSSRRDRDQDLDDREERRRKERRREKDHEEDRQSSRREGDVSANKHRSRRDRSTSYDRVREKRYDRDHDDRREKDRHRRDRDDYDRERRRDRGRYDDDRDKRHRR